MKIKFNHIQDLGDARYASAVMAEWIGFAIDGSYAITPEKIQQIIGWCSGPKLILEIYGEPNPLRIKSWFDVLPINGIECKEDDHLTLKEIFSDPELDWIIRNTSAQENMWSHSPFHQVTDNHITHINEPNEESAKWVINNEPAAISLHCSVEQELGKKDYELFNQFFETLEIL